MEYIKYFVEGECEEKLINNLKTPPQNFLKPGKVEVFNVVQNKLTIARIMSLKENTLIVFVYDVDKEDTSILEYNINILHKYGFKKIIHIHSIENFEHEIKFACNLTSLNHIFSTSGTKEFKAKFLQCSNIISKLETHGFNKNILWTRLVDKKIFSKYLKINIDALKQ